MADYASELEIPGTAGVICRWSQDGYGQFAEISDLQIEWLDGGELTAAELAQPVTRNGVTRTVLEWFEGDELHYWEEQ